MDAPPPSYAHQAPQVVGGTLAVDLVNTVGFRGRTGAARQERLSPTPSSCTGRGTRAPSPPRRCLACSPPGGATRRRPPRRWGVRWRCARRWPGSSRRGRRAPPTSRSSRPPWPRPGAQATGGGAGQLRWDEEVPRRTRRARAAQLMRPIWPVVWDAAALLSSPRRAAVHGCGDGECGWMFLDTSRGHTRRWCSMEDCGNRAKARRHYRRTQRGTEATARRG